MRSICIALFCAAAIIAVGFATAQADVDAVVAETAFVDTPPALADTATLVETLTTSETDDQDDDHDGHNHGPSPPPPPASGNKKKNGPSAQ